MDVDTHRSSAGRYRILLHPFVVGVAIPLAALAVQSVLWALISPFVWFLFYPAVFLCSWIGGKRAGLVSTVVSLMIVWWFFVPPATRPGSKTRGRS